MQLSNLNKKTSEITTNSHFVFCTMLSAKDGDPEAQNNLGVLYMNGQGVTRNVPESIELFKQAAVQGHIGAASNLNKVLNRRSHSEFAH